jgi:hypothetical protein
LALLRASHYLAAVVEAWIPRINRRRDLFGFADVLAVHRLAREPMLLVQSTTAAHVAHRLAKARTRPELAVWLAAGGAFQVHGWYQRAGRWQVKVVAVHGEDLEQVVLGAPRRRRGKRTPERGLFDGILPPGSTQHGTDNP